MRDKYTVGIIVVSDSCASGQAEDTSGINLKELINSHGENIYIAKEYVIVPDEIDQIKAKLIEWSDNLKLSLILTTGGSGLSPRDITPEATKEVIDKEVNSLSAAILVESLKITKFAMLSRGVSGIRKKTLIVNLPGSKKGSQESLSIILPVLKHGLDLINDSKGDIKNDHGKIQASYNDHQCPHDHSKSRVTTEDIINKPRNSIYPMISMDEAHSLIIGNSKLSEIEEVYYLDALDRICAEDVLAKDPLPPFAASVKDGFAIRLNKNQRLFVDKKTEEAVEFIFEVIGAANAGDALINIDLHEGQAVKINTGAPVPLKADAVIQIEDTISLEKNKNGYDSKIQITGSTVGCGGVQISKISIDIGQDIRPIGFDIKVGECVLRKRSKITAPQIGICATVGALKLKVYKLPTLGLISTGNELARPDEANLSQGQIRDSNKSLLYTALKSFGITNIVDAGIASDDADKTYEIFKSALEKSDIIISTGGVSMGDKDLVKDVLIKDFNCQIHFARLNMKPGKPTTFATCDFKGRRKILFCLPGNPVSAIVTFNLVVVPCLRKIIGYEKTFHTQIKVKCEFDVLNLDPRPEYHRALVSWSNQDSPYPSAYSTGNQHSSRLLSMNEANCLIQLPGKTKEKPSVFKGEILNALIIEKI